MAAFSLVCGFAAYCNWKIWPDKCINLYFIHFVAYDFVTRQDWGDIHLGIGIYVERWEAFLWVLWLCSIATN
jgi:hypothetical protein